ncbi:MAG: hypothetical protein JKY65_05830 [Planctomycetes bacterium]|nr:hypothetical protein [Planctomycetota bacterium]
MLRTLPPSTRSEAALRRFPTDAVLTTQAYFDALEIENFRLGETTIGRRANGDRHSRCGDQVATVAVSWTARFDAARALEGALAAYRKIARRYERVLLSEDLTLLKRALARVFREQKAQIEAGSWLLWATKVKGGGWFVHERDRARSPKPLFATIDQAAKAVLRALKKRDTEALWAMTNALPPARLERTRAAHMVTVSRVDDVVSGWTVTILGRTLDTDGVDSRAGGKYGPVEVGVPRFDDR